MDFYILHRKIEVTRSEVLRRLLKEREDKVKKLRKVLDDLTKLLSNYPVEGVKPFVTGCGTQKPLHRVSGGGSLVLCVLFV